MQNQNQSQLMRCEHKPIPFSPLVPVAYYSALVFPLFERACFSFLPRAWCLLIFPRLAPVAYFPALGICCLYSLAWSAPVSSIPAFGSCFLFSRAWRRLLVFALNSYWLIVSNTQILIGHYDGFCYWSNCSLHVLSCHETCHTVPSNFTALSPVSWKPN